MLLVLITTCLMYGNRFVLIPLDECRIGQCTDIDRFPASLRLSTPIFPLLGNNEKCRQTKMVIWSFLGYLGEIGPDCQSVWTCIYAPLIRARLWCHESALPIFEPEFAVVDDIELFVM